ncbi:hypothetical protein BJ508DRAFT_320026 [Ascobolus immersus RN42]|uniref:Uncharacterized protein n=1 Tax=Ascobolus immersus RN42 TaxID=1160509 RepID=A0A3N4IT55_ASCIM|nr:hypothetical protein BJ508DRAFT_320026 [Ascobolus immersus RN42]
MAPSKKRKSKTSAELYHCEMNFRRCKYTTDRATVLVNHWRTKHNEEWLIEQRREKAVADREMALSGRRAVFAGFNEDTAREYDLNANEEAYRIRLEANQKELESLLNAISDPTIQLRTRRRFDNPDSNLNRYERQAKDDASHARSTTPSDFSDESDHDNERSKADELDKSDAEDGDFQETESVLKELYRMDIQDTGFNLPDEEEDDSIQAHQPAASQSIAPEEENPSNTATDQDRLDKEQEAFFSTHSSEAAAEFAASSRIDHQFAVDPSKTEVHDKAGWPVFELVRKEWFYRYHADRRL